MSFLVNVNPNAPVMTLGSIVSQVKANCPKSITDSEGVWKIQGFQYGTTEGKDFCQANYSSGTSYVSYKRIFYNPVLVGTHDYPDFFQESYFLWQPITSVDAWLLSPLGSWFGFLVSKFGFPSQSASVQLSDSLGVSWRMSVACRATGVYEQNPGILPFVASWENPYPDKQTNVANGAQGTSNATNITPNYQVQQPGQGTTFQNDFNAALGSVNSSLNDPASGKGLGQSVSEMSAGVQELKTALQGMTTALQAALGGISGVPAAATSLAGVSAAASQVAGGQWAGHVTVADDPNGKPIENLKLAVKAAGDIVATLPSTDWSGLNNPLEEKLRMPLQAVAGAAASSGNVVKDSIDAHRTMMNTALTEDVGGKHLTQIVKEKPITLDVAPLTTEMDSFKDEMVTEMRNLSTAVAGVTIMGAAERAALVPFVSEAATAAGVTLPAVLGTTLTVAGGVALTAAGAYFLFKVFKDLLDTVKTIKDLTSDGKIDIKGEALAKLTALSDTLSSSLKTGNEAYLKQIRDALGWKAAPAENTFDESVRGCLGAIKADLDSLYVTNPDTGAKVSISQLLEVMGVEVKWGEGDFVFRF